MVNKLLKNPVAPIAALLALSSTAMASESCQQVAASTPWAWYIAPVSSVLALIFAFYFYMRQ